MNYCPVCRSELIEGLESWHLVCAQCRYEQSDLKVNKNLSSKHHNSLDTNNRKAGLKSVRKENFNFIISVILKYKLEGKLLEPGSGHSWFLEIANNYFDVLGIEPDTEIELSNKINVRNGLFPDCLMNGESFDIICFNDSFEHLSSIKNVTKKTFDLLNDDGIVFINLPSSNGIFYRTSKILHKPGASNFFMRMWNKDLPSPHLSYFNPQNLAILLKKNNFKILESGQLSSIHIRGLWQRIHYTKMNKFIGSIVFIIIMISYPFIKLFDSDICYIVAAKQN